VKVFVSSVTYLLKDERENLPPLLRLIGHDPLRFEDFVAPDASSRVACLRGVDAADAYVLLLGPRYGDKFPDSGMAPTHEEFETARRRGIPILVFVKNTDEPDQPEQADFKRLVGDYIDGRFWKTFNGPTDLNISVGESLKALPIPGAPLRLRRVAEPPQVPWLHATGMRPRDVDSPVLELHLLPVPQDHVTATALAAAAKSLARDLRQSGHVEETQPLTTGSDNNTAWAARPPQTTHHRSASSATGRTDEAWRGAAVYAAGSAAAWLSLSSDMFGTTVSRDQLRRDIAALIALAAPHTADAPAYAVALRLAPAGQLKEGDPAEMGRQTSGGALWGRDGAAIELAPEHAVDANALRQSTGDLANELATRVINDVRVIRAN
jgi:hypothetical protein